MGERDLKDRAVIGRRRDRHPRIDGMVAISGLWPILDPVLCCGRASNLVGASPRFYRRQIHDKTMQAAHDSVEFNDKKLGSTCACQAAVGPSRGGGLAGKQSISRLGRVQWRGLVIVKGRSIRESLEW